MRPLWIPLSLLLSGCAAAPGITLDGYRGLYSTHFDGVPDRSAVCALVTNRTGTSFEWVRLRLRSYSELGEERARWTSYWLYREPLGPGESAVVRLENPPVAEEIELRIVRAGSGSILPAGRPASELGECSDGALARSLGAENVGRTAPGMEQHRVARRGEPSLDVILAFQEGEAP